MATATICPDCGEKSFSAAEGENRPGCPFCQPTGETVQCPVCKEVIAIPLLAALRQELEDVNEDLREAYQTITGLQKQMTEFGTKS